MHPRHDRHARGVTGGSRTVSIGERHRTFRQTVKVWRLDSGMIVEWRDVVVQIIDRDEENVRLRICGNADP